MDSNILNNIVANLDTTLNKETVEIINQKDDVLALDIDTLLDNQNNFYDTDDIEQLKLSIENVGQLEPIIVSEKTKPNGEIYYLILSGHKRVRAHRELELKTIKAIVLKKLSIHMEDLILIEANQQRIKTPSELAKEINIRIDLYTKLGMKRTPILEKLSKEYNMSVRSIQRKEKQALLDKECKEALDKGELKVNDVNKVLNDESLDTVEISYEEIVKKHAMSIIRKAKKDNISKDDLINVLLEEEF